jgi:hypothetical protein
LQLVLRQVQDLLEVTTKTGGFHGIFFTGIYGKCRKAYQYKCGLHSTGGFCPLRENGHLFLMGYDGVMDQISHIHRTGNWDMT